jgi:hydrogenase-4 component D
VPEIIGWIGVVMAVITMIYAFLLYLPQRDMKRLLAYSTISQLSLIFMALSLSIFGSQLAFNGGIAHIFNHAFAKSLFFLVAGALSYSCGTRQLPALRGLLRTMPLLGIGFCVAALAITGVPPFNGFFSKFPIFTAGFQLSREHLLLLPFVVLALIESVASFAWFLKWFGATTPGETSEAVANASPVPFAIKLTLIVLIVMCVASSFIAANWLN